MLLAYVKIQGDYMKEEKKIVPDTSVIISGRLSELIEKGEIQDTEILIPEFVVEELRAQASRGREIGFKGLDELKKIRNFEKEEKVTVARLGRRQTMEEIQLAKYGRIDALILDVARDAKAVLYTSDMVQSLVAEAEGVETVFFKPYEKKKETKLSPMLTEDTMSLHLKENCIPLAKRGKPDSFALVPIREEPMTVKEMEAIIKDVMDAARYEEDSFIEVGGHAASVIQHGNMRIAVARPPFSDGVEITVVRPVIKMSLDDYKLSEKLKERLAKRAEGVILAGPPGSGKSTLAAAIAEFYEEQGKIVKTMESPRDLQVKPEITQYSKLKGSFENTADMLLLVRPDYTVFDEVRKTNDFLVFSDMRLAGIGMIGVVHATNPVDAVQRFVGRVELGMIPHVIDTIVYIRAGRIEKVYSLVLVVRTPTGMTEADLARPVVEVRNFENNEMEYELYTYGEETVIIPVTGSKQSAVSALARRYILSEVRKFDRHADVEIIGDNKVAIRVENDVIPRLIGKQGKTVQELEKKLGISIEVLPKIATLGKEVSFSIEETGAYLVVTLPEKMTGKIANFYIGEEYLFSATVGKGGVIRVSKDADVGRDVLKAIVKHTLKIFV
ncbi:MAG: Flp pilus assembly complex ATPase component TadA [Candidatus Aenigmarchaeota archaeon]|nr:Flp pilus assembly complex ATPase component TadA [Candidatus Aenigmarchaeota archaeon]